MDIIKKVGSDVALLSCVLALCFYLCHGMQCWHLCSSCNRDHGDLPRPMLQVLAAAAAAVADVCLPIHVSGACKCGCAYM